MSVSYEYENGKQVKATYTHNPKPKDNGVAYLVFVLTAIIAILIILDAATNGGFNCLT